MSHKLYSSPLQGFTDHHFRSAFNRFFSGIDAFYTPYIRFKGKLEIKSSFERDILPENNEGTTVIPQIVTNKAEEFLYVVDFIKQFGYTEINWNLGCPYPMVAKRNLGSGLISDISTVKAVLDEVYSKTDIEVSVKLRLGYESNDEIFRLLPILDGFPIKNIIIHPRIGIQLYKGDVDLPKFEECLQKTKLSVFYNGDISSIHKFKETSSQFPSVTNWLIGRWMIANPFLPQLIKSNTETYPENRREIFGKFHDTLFENYSQNLSGNSHILKKMQTFWEYFSLSFKESRKAHKKIKKSTNMSKYEEAVMEIFRSFEFV